MEKARTRSINIINAGSVLRTVLFSLLVIIVLTSMLLIIFNGNHSISLLLLSLVLTGSIATLLVHNRLSLKNGLMRNEQRICLQQIVGRYKEEYSFLTNLVKILEPLKEDPLTKDFTERYVLTQNKITSMESDIAELDSYSSDSKFVDYKIMHETLERYELKHNALKSDIRELSELLIQVSYKQQKSNFITKQNLTTLMYYLGTSIPILSDFTSIFNEFSKELILEVINKFGDITKSSHQIANDIEQSMNSLMDEKNENSLAFIIKKAHNLVVEFEGFYKNMESLKNSSNNFAEKTSEKLQNIQDIANSIEQIAETIKVLSLNVSIEAANAGNSGKGFQVLARDLREFTTKTMKFAHEVKSRVKDALSTTQNLKNDYIQSMNSVYDYMNEIKGSINSFESIIINSFEKIKSIINDLKRFSNHIDAGIKEVVGKLQYYDITSQEVEHLGLFIERIFMDLYNGKMLGIDMGNVLTQEEKLAIKKDVLKIINEIITTANERKILTKYEGVFGVKLQEDIQIDNKAATDIKGEADNIILF